MVKAYIYPVIHDTGVIKKVIANLYPTLAMENPRTAVITVSVNPLSADIDDPYTVDTVIIENPDEDSNGNLIDSNGNIIDSNGP